VWVVVLCGVKNALNLRLPKIDSLLIYFNNFSSSAKFYEQTKIPRCMLKLLSVFRTAVDYFSLSVNNPLKNRFELAVL
jgi:hypothetical protein